MAYTITQKPTTPNAAYTRLPYVISGSTNIANPQFQYIMDVYESGSITLLQRTSQLPNPAGVAVFDPSRIMQAQLAQDNSWKISGVEAFLTSSRTFTLEFGEQYGTSVSSSVTVSSSIATNNIEVFRGVVEPNNGIGYNWQSSSYAVLSNMPATMSMQTNDYGTISVYNNSAASTVSQSFYSASNSGAQLVQSKNYSVTGNFSSVPISSSTPYWNYAEVNVSSSLGIQSYRYEASDDTTREKLRFAFINKLGTWDYFNNYNPVKQSIDVEREQYTSPRVDYSSLTSTYDITRRGKTDYYNSTDDGFSVMTDYLDKTNANWIEELIESPSVYIQRNGEFLPIVITDSSYTANTNQYRQKLFQYTINFIPSNQPFGTWIPEYVTCPNVTNTPPVVRTFAATNVISSSVTLNGELVNDGGITPTAQGFIYSISSSIIPLVLEGADTTKVTSLIGVGNYSANTNINSSTYYQYRAYASNSLGINYGDTFYFDTILNGFDPTFQSNIQPELWYDFTDQSSVDFTSSADYGIKTIYNKGRYYNYSISGSLSVDQNPQNAFNRDWSPPIMTPGQYTQFSGDLTGASHDPSSQGTTTALPDWLKSNQTYSKVWSGSAATFIYFVRPEYKQFETSSVAEQGDIIGFASYGGSNRFTNLHLLYMVTSSIPDDHAEPPYLPTVDPITYVTGSQLATSSLLLYTQKDTGCGTSPPVPARGTALVVSDAMGEPTWHSYFLRYETGSSAPYGDFGLTTSVKTDINQPIKTNEGTCGQIHEGYGLVIGVNAAARATTSGGRNFKISHFLAYTSSLLNSEIDQVMSQFSQSVDFGNEINVYN